MVTDDWGDEGPLSVNSNSHNNVVLLWQVVLVSDGYLGSAADYDCRFGPRTQAATKAWQRANGLDDDGIVGPLTFGKADNKLRMDSDDGEIHYKGSRGIYRNSSGRWYMDDVNGVRHYFSYTSSSMCN
ncbi:peptidoglycan-binding protein [Streptomyces sp. NPDC051773]|uniref:peptidoglycan-binding domain-containing protein n=1 Tax=Streptomyces sp. NPDC051773 TaxID=3156682 RepID=UPI00342CEC1F